MGALLIIFSLMGIVSAFTVFVFCSAARNFVSESDEISGEVGNEPRVN